MHSKNNDLVEKNIWIGTILCGMSHIWSNEELVCNSHVMGNVCKQCKIITYMYTTDSIFCACHFSTVTNAMVDV